MGLVLVPVVLALTACTSSTPPHDQACGDGSATVSGRDAAGHSWHTSVPAPTEEAPLIEDGYVLVRHACGYFVLDLTDGRVAKQGDDTGSVGVANGFLYLVTHDDSTDSTTVQGTPVVGDAVDGNAGMSSLYQGDPDVSAYVVDDSLYVATEHYLESYDATGSRRWQTPLPILRDPQVTDAGDLVVATSAEGSVYALDQQSGQALWRTTVPEVAGSYTLSAHARGTKVDVSVGALSSAPTRLVLRATDGRIVRTRPVQPASSESLTANGDGWSVSITSDPVPHLGA